MFNFFGTPRLDRLEIAVESLANTMTLQQGNMELMQGEILDNSNKILVLQTEVRDLRVQMLGMQVETRRILDHLLGQQEG